MGITFQSFLRDLVIALIQVILFSICFTISLVVYIGLVLHNLTCRLTGNSHPRNRSCTSNRTPSRVNMLADPSKPGYYTEFRRKPVTPWPLNTPSDNHACRNFSKPQQRLQMPSTINQACSFTRAAERTDDSITSTNLMEPHMDKSMIMESLEFKIENSSFPSREAEWQEIKVPAELEITQGNTPLEVSNIVRESLAHASALKKSGIDREKGPNTPEVFTIFESSDTYLTLNPWASVDYRPNEDTRDRNNSTCSGTTFASESSCTFSKCSTGSSTLSVDTNPASVSWKEVLQVDPHKVAPGTMGFPSSAFIGTSSQPSDDHARGSRLSFLRKSCLRPKTSSIPERKLLKECASCFDEVAEVKAVSLSCQHSYCGECFTRLISTAVANEHLFPPRCCLINIPERTVAKNVDSTVLSSYRRAIKEYEVPAEDRWFCANLKCAKWFDASKLEKRDHNLKCPMCKTRMCRVCRGLSHRKQEDCPPNKELEATLETVHLQGWVRCRQCHAAIERKDGCLHIRCHCRAEFW